MPVTDYDDREAELLLFGERVDWSETYRHGTRRFNDHPVRVAREAIKRGIIDPHHSHNDAPPMGRLVDVLEGVEDHEQRCRAFVSGYAVAPRRDDQRVLLVGYTVGPNLPPAALRALLAFASEYPGDEQGVTSTGFYAGWD